jgi:hypothetical protein
MPYRVSGIPRSISTYVREHHRDPVYKHPAHTELATSYGPCRQCLEFFNEGSDRRTLLTYDMFLGVDKARQPGPIFIHEKECRDYSSMDEFPLHLTTHSLTFEGYGKGRKLRIAETIPAGASQLPVESFFSNPEVDYIIVRDTDAGCFDCVITRD